jgi:hypothetical protein
MGDAIMMYYLMDCLVNLLCRFGMYACLARGNRRGAQGQFGGQSCGESFCFKIIKVFVIMISSCFLYAAMNIFYRNCQRSKRIKEG